LSHFTIQRAVVTAARCCALQAEASRLQEQLDGLRSSSSSNAAAADALASLQARYEAAAAQLAALAGADERAAQLTAENDKLRERLERTEGQVG
jgi:DNA repair exonuclease SbcCD ATPase subunit